MALPWANELSTSKHLARADDKENYCPSDYDDARGANHTSCDRRDKNYECKLVLFLAFLERASPSLFASSPAARER